VELTFRKAGNEQALATKRAQANRARNRVNHWTKKAKDGRKALAKLPKNARKRRRALIEDIHTWEDHAADWADKLAALSGETVDLEAAIAADEGTLGDLEASATDSATDSGGSMPQTRLGYNRFPRR